MLHVGSRSRQDGDRYLKMLDEGEATVARTVTENLYDRTHQADVHRGLKNELSGLTKLYESPAARWWSPAARASWAARCRRVGGCARASRSSRATWERPSDSSTGWRGRAGPRLSRRRARPRVARKRGRGRGERWARRLPAQRAGGNHPSRRRAPTSSSSICRGRAALRLRPQLLGRSCPVRSSPGGAEGGEGVILNVLR